MYILLEYLIHMNKQILLVDDEPDIGFTIDFTLSRSGYKIRHVQSGEECIKLSYLISFRGQR